MLTLERLLELVVDSEREIGLAIETKHPTRYAGLVEERTVELLQRFGLSRPRSEHDSRIRIMSFSQLSMRRVRALAPGLPTVFLMDRVPLRFRDGSLPFGARIAGPSIEIVREHPRYVAARAPRRRAGARVDRRRARPTSTCACDLGVDAIITNRPGRGGARRSCDRRRPSGHGGRARLSRPATRPGTRVRSRTVATKQEPRPASSAPVATRATSPSSGMREPCPCGSGRRYKACHGRGAAHAGRRSCAVRSRASPARPTGSRCARSCPSATAPLTLRAGVRRAARATAP